MKKKTIALALVLVMAFGVTMGGTFAYLTSQDTVTNTFTVGNVQINLDEAQTDTAGVVQTNDDGEELRTETGNKYKLIPGHAYTKDPTVTVLAGSEESYVRLLVTVTYGEDADDVLAANGYQQWFDFNQNWTPQSDVKTTKADGKIARTYEFRYNTTVDGVADDGTDADEKLPALFTEIKIPSTISNTDLAKLADLNITVVAHAMQADGFNTADLAWAAWPTVTE